MSPEHKTLPMRLFEKAGLPYQFHSYDASGASSGLDLAHGLGLDPNRVFKTLVTRSRSGLHYVFMVPAAQSLDLKKAAMVCGEKALEMLPQKDLLPLTGYVHGGCSPLGMKKVLPSFIDETALLFETIIFSAGQLGLQIEARLADLQALYPLRLADLIVF